MTPATFSITVIWGILLTSLTDLAGAKVQARCKPRAKLFVDPISPFAYFYLKRLHLIDHQIELEIVPVLFGALLAHFGQLGPAEIASKRTHTYRQSVWLARRFQIPFRMPPRHPFNPLGALRLLASIGNPREAIIRTSEFVFHEGRDPELEFSALCDWLGIENGAERVQDPEVKRALQQQTQMAMDAGVFGVPTLLINGHCFWGVDTLEWVLEYLGDPQMFERDDMKHIDSVAWGIRRKPT